MTVKLIPILCLLLLVLWAPVPAGSAEQINLAGIWEGEIDVSGTKLGIVVEFAPGEEVEWIGDVDIAIQGAKDITLGNIRIDGGRVTFEMPGSPGDPHFDGVVSDSGRRIEGDFTQGTSVFPFWMILRDEATVAARMSAMRAKLTEIRSFIDSTRNAWQVPGLAVAVVRDEQVILAEGFGYRNLQDSTLATRRTLFPIGSATKAFTATALAMLVEEGLLDWDERITTYLPDFKLYDPIATEFMTTRDLLTHRSGLPRHEAVWYGSSLTREQIFERLAYLQPNQSFREGFQYQNLMYLAAGYLLEVLSERTWEEFVDERLLQPLWMHRTCFSIDSLTASPDHADPYLLVDGELRRIGHRRIGAMGPAGSINSCANEMATWLRFNLSRGRGPDDSLLLPPIRFGELRTPQQVVGGNTDGPERLNLCYGLGWFVEAYRGHRHVFHGGSIDGFSSMVSLFPDQNLGIVVLTNAGKSKYAEIVALNCADWFLDLSPVPFHDRHKARQGLALALQKEGEAARERHDRVKKTKPSHNLREYEGTYDHPAYGSLLIAYDKGKLVCLFRGLESILEHWHYDRFRAEFNDLNISAYDLQFHTNHRGIVDRISVTFEPAVDDIVFTRRPAPKLEVPSYLSRFEGRYDVAGQIMSFDVRGKRLVATVPGQPNYHLVPYRDTEFLIKGLKGYSVEFLQDDTAVVGVRFIQPNGVFEGARLMEPTPGEASE